MYLTYREVFSIKNICEWCVSSAVIMFVLMCLAIWRFLRGEVSASAAPDAPRLAPAEQAAPLGAARP
jgi:hypothetical protein